MNNNNHITVVISAYNESNLIEDCIRSARRLTRNIIVIDTESTDNTALIAKNNGVPVFSFPHMQVVEPSRNFAISKVFDGWFYILDADERLSDELITEIFKVINKKEHTWYIGPRLNIFAHKWPLRHGGWWPDPVIRLIKKSAFINWPSQIHSSPEVKGSRGHLRNPLLHYSQGNISSMVNKTIVFEDMESDLLYKAKRQVNTAIFFRKFFAEFYRRAIKNLGLLDGGAGIIASLYQAYSKTITYLMLYEKSFNN